MVLAPPHPFLNPGSGADSQKGGPGGCEEAPVGPPSPKECPRWPGSAPVSPGPHLSLPEEVQLLIALRSRLHVHSHAGEKPDSSRKPGPPPRRNLKRPKAPHSYFRPLDAHNLLVPPILPLWAGPVLRKLVGARRDATCAPWPEAASFRRLSNR